jgi:hypothetical protein
MEDEPKEIALRGAFRAWVKALRGFVSDTDPRSYVPLLSPNLSRLPEAFAARLRSRRDAS